MSAAYIKPYVKRAKTDAAEAQAICEAVQRRSMRFVPVKSGEQQGALALHRSRDLLVKQRTQLVNMFRGLLAEFGIEMARGRHYALDPPRRLVAVKATEVPALAQRVLIGLADQTVRKKAIASGSYVKREYRYTNCADGVSNNDILTVMGLRF
jgi:transposase